MNSWISEINFQCFLKFNSSSRKKYTGYILQYLQCRLWSYFITKTKVTRQWPYVESGSSRYIFSSWFSDIFWQRGFKSISSIHFNMFYRYRSFISISNRDPMKMYVSVFRFWCLEKQDNGNLLRSLHWLHALRIFNSLMNSVSSASMK